MHLLLFVPSHQYRHFANLLIFTVPSVAPSGLRVSRLRFSELKVQWNPIPQQSVNGRLLGYVVIYQEYPYWYSTKNVTTSSPDANMLVLSGLKAAHSYRVWVAGFTRVGTGPQSSSYYVTTGKLNKSTWHDVRKFKTEFVQQAAVEWFYSLHERLLFPLSLHCKTLNIFTSFVNLQ